MAFPRRLLHDGEELVLDLRPHWRVLARPSATLAAALAALVVLAARDDPEWLQLAAAAASLVALGAFVLAYARWATTSFVVTTDRLVHRSGVLTKRGMEIPLHRVNTVLSSQTLVERMLGSGDLVIESGGERGQQQLTDIPRAREVQREIHRRMEARRGPAAPGGAARPGVASASIPDQLEKLDELRRRGVISQAEFDAKKAQLLDRM